MSASGTVKKARDVNTQGIFPIRGKLPNAFRTSKEKFLSNEEIQGMIKIITGQDATSYNKHFDPIKDIEWEKIIIMADADVDGNHIASLFIRFMLKYMPQLIAAGKIYKAVPPLYSIPVGKREEYFTENIDFVRYIQKQFARNNDFKHLNKTPMTSKDATTFFMRNEDYVYYLERIANNFGVKPEFLEFALFEYYNKVAFKALKKTLSKKYRFMDIEDLGEGKGYRYDGSINGANILSINQQTIDQCKPILDIIDKNNEFYYLINGKESSIYEVMKGFEKEQPNHLQRYKGLGEMDGDQLAESTLIPRGQTHSMILDNGKKIEIIGDRHLIQYTLDDAKEEIEVVRDYESDFSKLFKFQGIVTRQDLID